MHRMPRTIVLLAAPLLLFACGQPPSPTTDPYAGGVSYPWSSTRPDGQLSAQTLTPGVNTLQYEPILAATNGWGPIEINHSNGEQKAGDGRTLTIGGVTYAKGFGVHANSEMRFSLKGQGATCTRFTVDVGVDDEVGARGKVNFQVYLDGTKAYDSGPQTGSDPARHVDLNISGKQELRLVVTDGGNGISYDHADWADPKIYCQAVQNVPLTMTVSPSTVEIFHKHTATVKATFSGTFNGPVNLSLPLQGRDGTILTLHTTQVSLPASGTGTVTRDVVIEAPALPSGTLGDPALLTASYRLVASQNGQEKASAPLTVTEKLLTVDTSLAPSSLSGPVGATRRVTVTVTVSPALAGPLPITLFETTQSTSDAFSATPVGAPYGTGGTIKQDFDIILKALPLPTETSAYGQWYVQMGGFIGYRLPYYPQFAESVNWTVQP